MSNANYSHLSFRFAGRDDQGGISVAMLQSDFQYVTEHNALSGLRQRAGGQLKTNEFWRLLHTLRYTKYADENFQYGFDYTLPMVFER